MIEIWIVSAMLYWSFQPPVLKPENVKIMRVEGKVWPYPKGSRLCIYVENMEY